MIRVEVETYIAFSSLPTLTYPYVLSMLWTFGFDQDYEAAFYGAFGSNHPQHTRSYFRAILDWQPWAALQV